MSDVQDQKRRMLRGATRRDGTKSKKYGTLYGTPEIDTQMCSQRVANSARPSARGTHQIWWWGVLLCLLLGRVMRVWERRVYKYYSKHVDQFSDCSPGF